MEGSLRDVDIAARSGDIDALYALLKGDPYLLETFDKIPFADTPLHKAATYGSTHFAIEVLTLKPSLSRKLNPDGFTPLHLAIRSGRTETVCQLVDCDPELIRVKGKERCTPLHYAAQVSDNDLLARFLIKCPQSIEDLNSRGQTAVHVAVSKGNVTAFKVLLGWLQRTGNKDILNWKDENDNRALHIAVSHNYVEIVRLLVGERLVRINSRNKAGQTPLDIAMGLPFLDAADGRSMKQVLLSAGAKKSNELPGSLILSNHFVHQQSFFKRVLSRPRTPGTSLKNLSTETRSALLVVAVLIATSTYQAVLTPPDGIKSTASDAINSNTAIPPHSFLGPKNITTEKPPGKEHLRVLHYITFMFLNTFPFLWSLLMMALLIPETNHNFLVVALILSLSLSYSFSGGMMSPLDLHFLSNAKSIGFAIFVFIAVVLTVNVIRNLVYPKLEPELL